MKNLKLRSDNFVGICGIVEKPDGYSDEPLEILIPIDQVNNLFALPEKPHFYEDTLAVWVPSHKIWVCFNRRLWQEKSSGSNPYEEEISKPFQTNTARLLEPFPEEIEKNGVVVRWFDIYSKGPLCRKCGSGITCRYLGDHGGCDYSFTWEHKCENPNCKFVEQFSNCITNQGQFVLSGREETSGNCPCCGNSCS